MICRAARAGRDAVWPFRREAGLGADTAIIVIRHASRADARIVRDGIGEPQRGAVGQMGSDS